MRKVRRRARPAFTQDSDFLFRRYDYERFRAEGGVRSSQEVLSLGDALGPFYDSVVDHAYRTFQGKCAYTEVPIEPRLELHRPEADAYDPVRDIEADHYWWTAMWHGNWYVASEEVAALKRNNFPVVGPRATPPDGRGELPVARPDRHLDRGLLLDPCRDQPLLHLRFGADGRVSPWSDDWSPWLAWSALHGQGTIELLDLNSPSLVESRLIAIDRAVASHRAFGRVTEEAVDPSLPHVGAIRQVLAQRILRGRPATLGDAATLLAPELVPLLAADEMEHRPSVFEEVLRALPVTEGRLHHILERAAIAARHRPRSVSPASEASAVPSQPDVIVIPRTAGITRVAISNFQAIADLEIDIPTRAAEADPARPAASSATSDRLVEGRPWAMFLGENGVGKSSVLKAIGLALAGDSLGDLVERCGLRWSDLLRTGTERGFVAVEFTGGIVVKLEFDRNGGRYVGRPHRMQTFIRGFGATRLADDDSPSHNSHVRLENLYDARAPVVHAERWLTEHLSDAQFNAVAVTLARLLDRDDELTDPRLPTQSRLIRRVDGRVHVGEHPLRMLSDGYRSMIALACALMDGAGEGLSDMRNASGIVLLDELGSHLHPRWKMRITRTLREVFPSLQFIVTTHEPLCLRGLFAGEVIGVRPSSAIRAPGWRAEFDRIEQSPSRLRVDQLLTSEFFGLDTAIDPSVDEQFQRYYAMIRRDDPDEAAERARLRLELSHHGVLGYTARDQLVYEAIDQFLARGVEMSSEDRAIERRSTLARVADIWSVVARQRLDGEGR
ncbi:AAA family ATPase [Nocardioides sp. LML1-1-1.1]|uniref:AAA family ATPase n=1 Tax=Nocardioides sp. LML1-1-1.1 TaxID=3135248 RepID=UPI00341890BF